MTPSDRIHYIQSIATELSKEEWPLIDLTLKQFDLPWQDSWNGGDKEIYVMDMISAASDDSLLSVAQHLGLASAFSVVDEPNFWKENDARIFLSHLTAHKKGVSAISQFLLQDYNVIGFVAHEDITPTKEWQNEIEVALSTMDALVAVITPKFVNSSWCDQEVGVAIGRKIPIIAAKFDQDPHGFIGKYQALQGMGKKPRELAKEIVELFLPKPGIGSKITDALVNKFSDSQSFEQSKSLSVLLESSSYLNRNHVELMKEAAKKNNQISGSWGVTDTIKRLLERYES